MLSRLGRIYGIARISRLGVRPKTALLFVLSGLALVSLVYWYAGQAITDGFLKVENDRTVLNVQRIKSALDEKISALDTLTRDWAYWDDTYVFIQDHNEAYIKSNPTDETMTNAGVSLIVFVDRTGQVVFAKAVSLTDGTEVSVPEGIHKALLSDAVLADYASLAGRTGIISLPEGPLLFATRPILTSAGAGPARGTLLMGRYLDAKVVDSVSENTHLPVTSAVLDGSAVPADFQRAVAVMSAETPFFISPVSGTTIAGYVLITDIEHKPVAVLRANMPRDIYQQGIASINYTMASIAALVAVFLVLVFVVLERLVLSRLARMGVDVGEIGESGDLKKRVRVQGEDEISRLGNAVNGMLTSLERSESQLRESEAKNRVILETIKEKTKQLEEAFSAAKASSQAKSEFLASMSHELRTPLNAIIGFSQVLHEQYFGSLNDKQAEYVTDIVDSGRHLLSLINDILDLSKVEAGKMELEISGVKILDLLQNSLVMIKEKALAHSLNLEVQIAEDIQGLEIVADERRLKQVMFNLLSNATKFTPDGGAIKVEARKEGKELIISVSDTGIGMTPQEQKRLFEAFYQASGGLKDKTPGTGLGLAITKSIVEKHGGRIWLESEGSNKGSRFTFTLPI